MENQKNSGMLGNIYYNPPQQQTKPTIVTESNEQQQQQAKRRRYRIPRSCDRCRASKIKCAFQDGQCTACANARVACTFANPGSLKERPPTQKDVEYLQARIRSLERLIHAIDPTLNLTATPELIDFQDSSADKQHRPSFSSFNSSPSEKISQFVLPNQEPDSESALTSLFFPSQIKLNASAVDLPYSQAYGQDLSPADKIIRQQCVKTMYWKYGLYPEPDLEQNLIEIYFKHVHPCLPIVHPASFIQNLESGLSRTSDSFRALCLMMMAISSRFSKDPRVFLDSEGNPQQSRQSAGLRYALIVGAYLFQPISAPADIHDLQAILIMVIYSLGCASPDATWDFVGLGLSRAQEIEAHLEKSPRWANSPLQDHLRRKAFILLYEFDCFLSAAIGKPSYMQESDFDVLPHDLEFEIAIGSFINPFDRSQTANGGRGEEIKISNDIGIAYWTLKSSFGGLKNLLPLVDLMRARKDSSPGIQFLSCIELLINQLDSSMTKCYSRIAQKFSAHQSSNANLTDAQLTSSVNAVTWYHEFRLLTHKVLLCHRVEKSNPREETGPNSNKNQDGVGCSTSKYKYPHAEICIESARNILSSLNQLHQRNLLELGFYWIPLRLTNALIILIICFKICGKKLSPDQQNLRHYEISLGLEILNTMAPTTFLAEKCLKLMVEFQECTRFEDPRQIHKKLSSLSPQSVPSSASTSSPSSQASEELKNPNPFDQFGLNINLNNFPPDSFSQFSAPIPSAPSASNNWHFDLRF